MKLSMFLSTAIVCFGVVSEAHTMTLASRADISLRGTLNQTCISTRGGTVYLQMDLIASGGARKERRPMNIAVVLDRSGSMADERKIDYAKAAVNSLIDRLSPDDYFSIVIYDDQIETILPTQCVRDKRRIHRLVNDVYPGGSTNLGGGMVEGFRQAERNMSREYINRVILLSDGLANTGVTDPHELNRIASRYRNESISLSTMGVGLDYNENLMLGLAEHGGGNYYFIESPSQLASIFERELNGLVAVVAQNSAIELTLGRGVTLNDVIGCEWKRDGDQWIIPVGDVYANEHREFTVQLNIPEGTGSFRVARGVLKYKGAHGWLDREPEFTVDIHYSNDAAEIRKGTNWDTQAKVDVAVSTKAVERAMAEIDAGRHDEAEKALNDAKEVLQSSPAVNNSAAGAGMIQSQIKQLDAFSREAKDENVDKRRLKKSMQYQNYQTQKKKE